MDNQNSELKDTAKAIEELFTPQTVNEIEYRLKEINDRTTEFVKKNPITSLVLAVSVGFVLGRIFSGRRS